MFLCSCLDWDFIQLQLNLWKPERALFHWLWTHFESHYQPWMHGRMKYMYLSLLLPFYVTLHQPTTLFWIVFEMKNVLCSVLNLTFYPMCINLCCRRCFRRRPACCIGPLGCFGLSFVSKQCCTCFHCEHDADRAAGKRLGLAVNAVPCSRCASEPVKLSTHGRVVMFVVSLSSENHTQVCPPSSHLFPRLHLGCLFRMSLLSALPS